MPGPGRVRYLPDGSAEITNDAGAVMRTTALEAARLTGDAPQEQPSAPQREQPFAHQGAPGSMFVPGAGSSLSPAPVVAQQAARRRIAGIPDMTVQEEESARASQPSQGQSPAQPVFAGGGAAGAGGVLPQNTEIFQRYVPGGPARDVRTGYSVRSTPGVDLPSETMDELRAGDPDAYAATLNTGKVEGERDEALAGNLSGLQDTLAGREQARRGNEDDRIRRVDEMRQGYLRELQGATSVTVDPDRRNTGQQVLSGIAAFLDGLAGSSDVMNHIQRTLAADMEAQRERIRQGETRVRETQTAYEMARQQMGDERGAEQAATAYEMEAAAREAERIGLMASSSTVRNRATVLASEFRRQALMQYVALEQARMGQRETSEQFRRMPGGGGWQEGYITRNPDGTTGEYRTGGLGSALNAPRMTAGTAAGMRFTDQPAGGPQEALPNAAQERVVEAASRLNDIQSSVEAIRQLRSPDMMDVGGAIAGLPGIRQASNYALADNERSRELEARIQLGIIAANKAGFGVLSDQERELILGLMPNLRASEPATRRASLDRLEQQLLTGARRLENTLDPQERAELMRRSESLNAAPTPVARGR